MASARRTRPKTRGAPRPAPARKTAAGKGPRRMAPRSAPPAEVEIDAEVMEFIEALDRYRRDNARPFPSWSEVMHVLRALGYRKSG
jgi:hypothetical protein